MRKLKRRQKKQLAFLTFVVLIASVIAIVLLTPIFEVQKIEVRGNSVLKDEEVVRASGIVEGINIFGVNLGEAKENLKNLGYVESVKVKRALPSTVEITVVEEVGVGYIKAKDGYVIITADGRCIDIDDGLSGKKGSKKTASLPKLPLIKGLKNVKYKVGNLLKSEDESQLNALISCLHEFSKYGYIFDMREIDVTDLSDIKFYYRSKELCVTIGSPEKIGYKIVDLDKITHEIYKTDKECVNEVKQAFGDEIIDENGDIIRKKLGEIVFCDKEKLNILNEIVHKYILKKALEEIKLNNNVVVDAPLLFEAGLDKVCDITLGIISQRDKNAKRIQVRDNISIELAKSRLDKQYQK